MRDCNCYKIGEQCGVNTRYCNDKRLAATQVKEIKRQVKADKKVNEKMEIKGKGKKQSCAKLFIFVTNIAFYPVILKHPCSYCTLP